MINLNWLWSHLFYGGKKKWSYQLYPFMIKIENKYK